MSDPQQPTPDAIADTAWRYLVNWHDLAQAVHDPSTAGNLGGLLQLAVERLRSAPTPRPCAPTGGPHNP